MNIVCCVVGIGVLVNCVFVFGGESEDDVLDSVECWDVEVC